MPNYGLVTSNKINNVKKKLKLEVFLAFYHLSGEENKLG